MERNKVIGHYDTLAENAADVQGAPNLI